MIHPLCRHDYIRPFRTSNFHPPRMIRLLCGLWFISVHFGLQIFHPPGIIRPLCGLWFIFSGLWFIFVYFGLQIFHPPGMIRPLCGPLIYICPFRTSNFSSSWDDPSTLWTFSLYPSSVHFGLQIFHPPEMIHPLCGYWFISVHFRLQIFHPLGMIRPLCGPYVYTYPFIIKIHIENHSCI